MGITLFHQPGAGEEAWSAERLLSGLAGAGIRATYCSTAEDGWRDCVASARELVIAAGGDGTVARIASSMPDRNVKLALLPLGSANNIARSLGYPDAEVADLVAGFSTSPTEAKLRIGEVRGRWGVRRFVEAVGLGALARTVATLQDASLVGENKRRAGRAALARTIAHAAPVRAAVCADDESLSEPALLVECMNISTIGPNLRLAADARPGEEHLSLVWLPQDARDAMIEWLREPDGSPPPVRHRRVCRVEIDALDEPLRIDDKTVEWDGSRISLRLLDPPITVLVPGRTR